MSRSTKAAFIALTEIGLAACQQTAPSAPMSGAQMAPPPATRPAQAVDSVPAGNKQACLQAVRKQTQNPELTVISTETSEANDLVMVGVGPTRAPWRCLVKRGVVAEVMSMTNEGRL
jgi:nucleoid-associated protein YgaU